MTVETSLERLNLLNDFGIDVAKSSGTIKAIFDNPYQNTSAGGEVSFSIQECYIEARTEDVTDLAEGSLLTINDSSYAVTDIQPDGTGFTVLMLEAQ